MIEKKILIKLIILNFILLLFLFYRQKVCGYDCGLIPFIEGGIGGAVIVYQFIFLSSFVLLILYSIILKKKKY